MPFSNHQKGLLRRQKEREGGNILKKNIYFTGNSYVEKGEENTEFYLNNLENVSG